MPHRLLTRTSRLQAGVTFTELVVLVAIVGCLAVGGATALNTTMKSQRGVGAARFVLAQIRQAQSLAITRHGVFALQWGGDPGVSRSTAELRIVQDTTGSCGFPGVTASQNGTTVVRGWTDIGKDYPTFAIESVRDSTSQLLGGVMFDARGASVNTCGAASFPLTVTIGDGAGRTYRIQVRSAGNARLL